ncbi:MAG: hypothetical protein OQL11_09550 [Gammaproteobacteria bacterium]|nr:hypothetical protein [Gammaproteobacteria bacterium]
MKNNDTITAGLILYIALVIVALAYLPALSAGFHFDDIDNLAGLSKILDTQTALDFIFGGQAVPLGRPVALASFAAQAHAWPSSPGTFLYTNICIHLLNGLLVAWVAYLINIGRGREQKNSSLIAVISAGIWMILPLLVSSNLFIIQRMTTLTSGILLVSLVGYLKARQSLNERPCLALTWMTLCLIIGTSFATLSKENGILLPAFVLVLESTLLRKPEVIRPTLWRIWKGIFMFVPLIIIVVFLARQLPYPESTVIARQYTGAERLLTQAHVMWLYIWNAFIPNPSALGPFHDDQAIYRYPLSFTSVVSVLGWCLAILIAIIHRKRRPEISFAVGWFMTGHLLESSTVALELYFEHRNYTPIIGPIFAVVTLLLSTTNLRFQRLAHAGLAAYSIALIFTLINQTSLWGSSRLAAEMWAIQKPDSPRAITNLAMKLETEGEFQAIDRILSDFLNRHPHAQIIRLQKIIYSCNLVPENSNIDINQLSFTPVKNSINFATWASRVPEILYAKKLNNNCENFNENEIASLANNLLAHPDIQYSKIAIHNLNSILSAMAINRGDFVTATINLDKALSASFNIDTLEVALRVAVFNSDFSRAESLLNAAEYYRPTHPVKGIIWDREIDRMTTLVSNRKLEYFSSEKTSHVDVIQSHDGPGIEKNRSSNI